MPYLEGPMGQMIDNPIISCVRPIVLMHKANEDNVVPHRINESSLRDIGSLRLGSSQAVDRPLGRKSDYPD